jgi:hypothetical protein
MGETSEGKRACAKYGEKVSRIRSEMSDLLKTQLRMEMYISDDGVMETKLFDTRTEPSKEVVRLVLDTRQPDKNMCKVDVEWTSIPEVSKYEEAFLAKNAKFKLSGKPLFNRLLFRKEKELMSKIMNVIGESMSPDLKQSVR